MNLLSWMLLALLALWMVAALVYIFRHKGGCSCGGGSCCGNCAECSACGRCAPKGGARKRKER